MFDILFRRKYLGCELQYVITEDTIDPSRNMLLHLACQCHTMRTRPTRGRGRLVGVYMRAFPRRPVRVPEASLYSYGEGQVEATNRAARDSLVTVGPRLLLLPREQHVPVALQGVPRFRGRCVFCIVSAEEPNDYLGSVGASAHMYTLLNAIHVCTDWDRLTKASPTPQDLVHFLTAHRILEHGLRKSMWPTFAYVEPRWPSEMELVLQYKNLCARVRERFENPRWHASYSRPISYMIAFCHLPAWLYASLGGILRLYTVLAFNSLRIRVGMPRTLSQPRI